MTETLESDRFHDSTKGFKELMSLHQNKNKKKGTSTYRVNNKKNDDEIIKTFDELIGLRQDIRESLEERTHLIRKYQNHLNTTYSIKNCVNCKCKFSPLDNENVTNLFYNFSGMYSSSWQIEILFL